MGKRKMLTVALVAAFALPWAGVAQAYEENMQHPRDREVTRAWTLPKQCKNPAARILYRAGFRKPGMLRGMWAITWRESRHRSLDESSPWYSGALGWAQIQTSTWSGQSWWSRSAMLSKHRQSRIIKKHFFPNKMHHWGYGYDRSSDSWYPDAGQYYAIWGSSLTYAWVIGPFNTGWSLYPKECR